MLCKVIHKQPKGKQLLSSVLLADFWPEVAAYGVKNEPGSPTLRNGSNHSSHNSRTPSEELLYPEYPVAGDAAMDTGTADHGKSLPTPEYVGHWCAWSSHDAHFLWTVWLNWLAGKPGWKTAANKQMVKLWNSWWFMVYSSWKKPWFLLKKHLEVQAKGLMKTRTIGRPLKIEQRPQSLSTQKKKNGTCSPYWLLFYSIYSIVFSLLCN